MGMITLITVLMIYKRYLVMKHETWIKEVTGSNELCSDF